MPPYVLRSWETEFPALCGTKNTKGGRRYARSEVELVLRIKGLVFGEGLTLGAARKKLEGGLDEDLPRPDLPLEDMLGADVRQKLAEVKHGLQAVLALLSGNGGATPALVPAVAVEPARRGRSAAAAGRKPRGNSVRGSAPAAKAAAKRKRRTA